MAFGREMCVSKIKGAAPCAAQAFVCTSFDVGRRMVAPPHVAASPLISPKLGGAFAGGRRCDGEQRQ